MAIGSICTVTKNTFRCMRYSTAVGNVDTWECVSNKRARKANLEKPMRTVKISSLRVGDVLGEGVGDAVGDVVGPDVGDNVGDADRDSDGDDVGLTVVGTQTERRSSERSETYLRAADTLPSSPRRVALSEDAPPPAAGSGTARVTS